jgi:membrane protein DedA with SNARE-associated domain
MQGTKLRGVDADELCANQWQGHSTLYYNVSLSGRTVMEELLNQLSGYPALYLYSFLFIILAFFGLIMPEDIPLVTAGFLSYLGAIRLEAVIPVAFVAVLVGDTVIYTIGRKWGLSILALGPVRKVLSEKRLDRVRRYFNKYGERTIFLARFIVGLRAVTFWAAGTLKVPYWRFLIFDALAAIISVPVFILIGWYFGHDIERAMIYLANFERALLLAAVLVLGGLLVIEFRRKAAEKGK